MSYILSALKKAEQERGDNSALSASLLAAEAPPEREGLPSWVWVVLGVVLFGLLLGAGWLLVSGPEQDSMPGSAVSAPAVPIAPPAGPGGAPAADPEPVGADFVAPVAQRQPVVESEVLMPAPAGVPPASGPKPPLPEIEFGGHIYVEGRPAAGKLFADGKAWREGDSMDNGVSIVAISENAVSLEYRGHRYQVSME